MDPRPGPTRSQRGGTAVRQAELPHHEAWCVDSGEDVPPTLSPLRTSEQVEDELASQAELIRRQAAEIALLRADNVALQAELRLTADLTGRSDSSGQAPHEGAGRADGNKTVAESGGAGKQPPLAREDRDAAHDDGETKASSTDSTRTHTGVRTPSHRPPGWRSTFWSWLSSTKQSRADDGYDGDND